MPIPNYTIRFRGLPWSRVIGYDPQLLLTDQRTPEKRYADALVADYRASFPWMTETLFPSIKSLVDRAFEKPRGASYFFASGDPDPLDGDAVDRRWGVPSSPADDLQHGVDRVPIDPIFPGDEIKLRRPRTPTFRHQPREPEMQHFGTQFRFHRHQERVAAIDIDFGKNEERVLAQVASAMRISGAALKQGRSSFAQAAAALDRFGHTMREVQAKYDSAVAKAAMHVYIRTPTRRRRRGMPVLTQAERLEYLIRSPDPRQRKRGTRLSKQFLNREAGFSFKVYGETYDPALYRKD